MWLGGQLVGVLVCLIRGLGLCYCCFRFAVFLCLIWCLVIVSLLLLLIACWVGVVYLGCCCCLDVVGGFCVVLCWFTIALAGLGFRVCVVDMLVWCFLGLVYLLYWLFLVGVRLLRVVGL